MSAVIPPSPRPGRPPCCPLEVVLRVVDLRRQGLSLARISTVLNAEGVPTPEGRAGWQKSYVDRLLHTRYVREIINSHT